MSALELLARLEARGVALELSQDFSALRVEAPAGAITPELRRELGERKEELIDALFDREERAALQGAPEGCDSLLWQQAISAPQVQAMITAARPFGGVQIVSVERLRAPASIAA
jgi:RecA/RadA recombinase